MKALIIKEPHVSNILNGLKTWEIRGSSVKYRGRLFLAQSGTGLVVGECILTDVCGPLTYEELVSSPYIPQSQRDMHIADNRLPYLKKNGDSRTYGWVLSSAKRLQMPVPYHHPQGAVIFVDLKEKVFENIS